MALQAATGEQRGKRQGRECLGFRSQPIVHADIFQ
jgi:hypothetical protein